MFIASYANWSAYNMFLIISHSSRPIYDQNLLRLTLNYKKPCHVYGLCQTLRHSCCCFFFICHFFQFYFVFFLFHSLIFLILLVLLYICLHDSLSKFEICGRKWIGYVIILYIYLCESLSKLEICGRKWIGYVIIFYLQPPTWSHFLFFF